MDDLTLEIEKLKFEMKMKRRSKAAFFLGQIAILSLLTYGFYHYLNNAWYWALLKSIGVLILTGFLILVFKFIKYVKNNRKAAVISK